MRNLIEDIRYALRRLRKFPVFTTVCGPTAIRMRLATMNSAVQDVRFALRQLEKCPGFTAAAGLTFPPGMGTNPAVFVFSVAAGAVFQPLALRYE